MRKKGEQHRWAPKERSLLSVFSFLFVDYNARSFLIYEHDGASLESQHAVLETKASVHPASCKGRFHS
jgi:hypothetical protein